MIAEKFEIARGRDAEAKARPKRFPRFGRPRPTQRIVRIEAGGDLEYGGCVRRGQRKDRYAVERAARGNDAVRAQQPASGLEPDEVVKRGGDAARSRRVGAERKTDEARRHRDRRARARSARNIARVERVARHAKRRARTDEAGRELVEIGLADQHRSGGHQPLNDRGRSGGRVGKSGAGGRGRHAGDIDIVFHGKRNAEQRQLCVPAPARPWRGRRALLPAL